MSLDSILSPEDMQIAVNDCKAPDSFCYKKFFKLCGLSQKSAEKVNDVFCILDKDGSGFLEEEELKFLLQQFSSEARTLSDKEVKSLLKAANNDKIGKEEFKKIVLP